VKRKGQWELGRLLLESGRLDEGVRLLKEQISAAPMDPMAEPLQVRLAQALLDAGRHTNAIEEFQHYLETYTNLLGQAQAQQGKGWGLLKTGRFAEAATAFSRAYDLFTDPAARERCLFKVGDAYFANTQYELASEAFERVLKEGPASSFLRPHALFQLGESLSRAREGARAEKTFQELIEKHPGSSFAEEGLLRMAEIKSSGGRWAEALRDYDRFLAAYTNGAFLAEAIHQRGTARYRLYRFQEAWDDFERVVRSFPTNVLAEHAFYMRGMCQYGVWRDTEALATFRDFLNKYPESQWTPDVRFWLARYQYNQRSFAEAEKTFLEFVDKHGTNDLSDDALLFAGKSARKRNEYVRAADLLAQFVKKYGDRPGVREARVEQAEALSEQGNYPGAILVLDEVTHKGPPDDWTVAAWIRKGDFQIVLGADDTNRYEESIRSYRAALEVSGASPDRVLEAEYKIGRCLEKKLNRPDEAFEQYHERVIVRFLDDREKGRPLDERCKDWFTKATFDAAGILEAKKEPRKALHVLQRVVDAGVPAAEEARERIRKIRTENWHLLN
jgi:TolA-binding protein